MITQITTEPMAYLPLEPIHAQIEDPKTGLIYTFTAVPPSNEELDDILSVPAAEYAFDMTPKEFVQVQCWRALRVSTIEQLRIAEQSGLELIRQLLPLLTGGIYISVEKPTIEGESVISRYGVSCSQLTEYTSKPGVEQPPSEQLAEEIARRVSRSPIVKAFIEDYLGLISADLLDLPPTQAEAHPTNELPTVRPAQKKTLFANSKDVTDPRSITVPKVLADGMNSFVREISALIPEQVRTGTGRFTKVRVNRKSKRAEGKMEQQYAELYLANQNALRIKTVEECAKELLRIRKPETLQCFFALWSLATQQDSARLTNVSLSQLMKLVLKVDNPNKEARQQFTDVLHLLADISIDVRQVVEDRVGDKGKLRPMLKVIPNVRILEFREVAYSVRRAYQHLPKEELRDEYFDHSVITKFSATLLPKSPELFTKDASVYMNSLLSFDANKDGRAVIAGFAIQTRFNQNKDKALPIGMLRSQLVELCDYEKTNQTKVSKATSQLAKVFDKLKEAGIISRYEGLTNVDNDRVSFYPPAQPNVRIENV